MTLNYLYNQWLIFNAVIVTNLTILTYQFQYDITDITKRVKINNIYLNVILF